MSDPDRGERAVAHGEVRGAGASQVRVRVAQMLAAVALIAGVVGAVGPADHVRTTYSWPPEGMPSGTPATLWYTPLLLIRHQPETLSASIPCSPRQALPAAGSPLTVLASARNAAQVGGLAVTKTGDRLVFAVGDRVLGTVRSGGGDPGCAYLLTLGDGRWSIEGGPDEARLENGLDAMPVVTGLFSGLDLRSGARPSIEVATSAHASETTFLQTIAWVVAGLAIVAALLLVAFERRPRRLWATIGGAVRAPVGHAHVADGVVAAVLLVWWVVSPVFWDDGWVVARERTFAASRGFSTFYNAFGVNLPLDYWVEWLQHWLTQSSSALLLLRLPSLACLAATWVLCRWALARLSALSPPRGDVAIWALTAGFLACALAWGMTLRPEPVTALLATGVLACAIRFAERETVAPIAACAFLVPLALTAHHTGIASVAPLLAVAPQLVRWAQHRLAVTSVVVMAALAQLLVLAFVGSDLEQRLDDVRTTSTYGITQSWRDELERYVLLGDFPFGAPLRRASAALLVLAVVAFMMRRRREKRLLDLPATSLGISLILLLVTPSKLPWHFGALIGIAALTIAAETRRMRDDTAHSRGWQLWPFAVVGAGVLTTAWVWGPREAWNPLDLVTVGWTPGLDDVLPYARLAVALPLLLLAGALALDSARRRAVGLDKAPWRVASWTAPVLVAPLLVFTAGLLVADAVKTGSWTLTRQNLGSLVGDQGCGLAEDVLVSKPSSARPLSTVEAVADRPVSSWVPPAPVSYLPRFELRSPGRGSAGTPWFTLPEPSEFGLFVAAVSNASERLELEWGRGDRGRMDSVGSGIVVVPEAGMDTASWFFLAASELPAPALDATAIRVKLRSGLVPGAAVAVTAPFTYTTELLADRLGDTSSRTIVHPNLLLYFPCAKQPRLDDGVVDAPRHIVWFDHPFQPHPYEPTSPFLGVRDLYEVERRPLAGSKPPPGVVVFEVERRIPGAQVAPPDTRAS